MITPRELKALYEQGENVSEALRREEGAEGNTEKIIELSYDLQTGSYVTAMDDPEIRGHKEEYAAEIARVISDLCSPDSIMEAGIGEATTLSGVVNSLGIAGEKACGFDISWSRVAWAKSWLAGQGIEGVTLCTGSLLHVPFADSSVDVVYTSHSIEPNGGKEEPILQELYRVAAKYLVLLEPGYDFAGEEARARMTRHGYCRNLKPKAEALGYEVLEHKPFPHVINPLNPTALTVIKKEQGTAAGKHLLACPRFKTPLEEIAGMLYSPEALCVYPVVAGIPCLRIENAVVASRFPEVAGD